MKAFQGARLCVYVVASSLTAACAPLRPAASGPVPDALAAFIVWAPAAIESSTSAKGFAVDLVQVRGGEVVRLELRDSRAVDVAERSGSGAGAGTTEAWTTFAPNRGVVLLRPRAFASALLVPRGRLLRAQVGHGSDPGYYWFALEQRVLDWAAGPLPAPFPELAPRSRLDLAGFAALDRTLADALARAKDPAAAAIAARAIRRVAGLRAVRALRPPTGFPYFFDARPDPKGPVQERALGGRLGYELDASSPLELPVEGPAILHVYTLAEGSSSAEASTELRVLEGDRLRALTGSSLPRAALTNTDPAVLEPLPTRALRRALVHVPPGPHLYRLETTTRALVAPLLARPIVHVEDAAAKNEQTALASARRACVGADAPAICALALALLGADRGGLETPSGELSWTAAIAASPDSARRVAEALASGGPRDPTLALELAASGGDPAALAELGNLIAQSIDDGTRAAWMRALWRGTEWTLVASEPMVKRWSSLVRRDGSDGSNQASCAAQEPEHWPTLAATEHEFVTSSWHGVPTLELLVTGSCDDPQPVELMVDGQPLTANPSAGLVRWHVRVRGQHARARRIDAGRARVYALPVESGPCASHWDTIRAPQVAATAPRLEFGAAPQAPGVEVWLREDTKLAELRVTGPAASNVLRIVAARVRGVTAYDETGVRWTKVGRIALPAWAASGVQAKGGPAVAVRALVRTPRESAPAQASTTASARLAAASLDEDALVALSRRILATPSSARGPLHLERALMLAAGGAEVGALADARAAEGLGTRGPAGENAIELVRAAIRRRIPPSEPLPAELGAYGVEADFDPGARRCDTQGSGERAQFQRLLDALAPKAAERVKRPYDAALAARALAARERNPLDPRGGGLVARALADSRWRSKRELGVSARRIRRERSGHKEGPVDARGELRARVIAGAWFEDGTFASVTPERAAQAVLSGLPSGARVRVDLACVAQEPARALGARCPLELQLGSDPPLHPELAADGRGSVALQLANARPMPLEIRVAADPARWVALARIVLDRPAPAALKIADLGWVLQPKRVENRSLLGPGEELALAPESAAVLRIDLLPEDPAPVEAVAQIDGHARPLPVDGSPVVIPLPEGGRVLIKPVRGRVSVAVAERVPNDIVTTAREDSADSDDELAVLPQPPPVAAPALRLDLANAAGPAPAPWIIAAQDSPPPLTPIETSLGTVVFETGAIYGTLRQGSGATPAADGFVFGIAGYRRRIEALRLWTNVEAFSRVRVGEPTFGGGGALYDEIEALHVRLWASLGAEAQQIAGIPAHVWLARGFAEYSWRATRDFFLLPRVGYDGTYMSLHNRPTSLAYVDDEVYNTYRATRPNFLFAQALLWYAPYFNQITYLRLRASLNPNARVFSHLSVRPGAFVAFGGLDLSTFIEGVWYAPADSVTHTARFNQNLGFVARYDLWSYFGSLDLQPGFAAFAHLRDGGWQVNFFINLFASYRRGLRDFSSLELDFPEQLGGGIPWRGATPGGYR